nr:unnamed protein product [Digitaria exilis]
MGPTLSPSSVAVLSTAGYDDDDYYYEDDDFEFTPLLLKPRRRWSRARTERPRTTDQVAAATIAQLRPPPQRARRRRGVAAVATTPASRKVRWHDMAFGSVRVPAAMDMGEIRRRLNSRPQALAGNEPSSSAAAAGWAPWRLIRSLSCKGVEAVTAAAAPVRLV